MDKDQLTEFQLRLENKIEKASEKSLGRIQWTFGFVTTFLTITILLIGGGSYLSIQNANKTIEKANKYEETFGALEKEKTVIFSKINRAFSDTQRLEFRTNKIRKIMTEQNKDFQETFLDLISNKELEDIIGAMNTFNMQGTRTNVNISQNLLIRMIVKIRQIVDLFKNVMSGISLMKNSQVIPQYETITRLLGKFVEPESMQKVALKDRKNEWKNINIDLAVEFLKDSDSKEAEIAPVTSMTRKYVRFIKALLIYNYMGLARSLAAGPEMEYNVLMAKKVSNTMEIPALKKKFVQFCDINAMTLKYNPIIVCLLKEEKEKNPARFSSDLKAWEAGLKKGLEKQKKITADLKVARTYCLNLIREGKGADGGLADGKKNKFEQDFRGLNLLEIRELDDWSQDLEQRINNNLAAICYYGVLYKCFKDEEVPRYLADGKEYIQASITASSEQLKYRQQMVTPQPILNYYYVTQAELLLLEFFQKAGIQIQDVLANQDLMGEPQLSIKKIRDALGVSGGEKELISSYTPLVAALGKAGNIFDLHNIKYKQPIDTILYKFKNLTIDKDRLGDHLGKSGKLPDNRNQRGIPES